MQKIIKHHLLGEILIKKRAGLKSIRLTVHPIKGVNVSIPYFTGYSFAESFIEQKLQWILKAQKKLIERKKSRELFYQEGVELSTIKRVIRFKKDERANIKIILSETNAEILYPNTADINFLQAKLKEALLSVYKQEAKEVLPDRLKYLANIHGFKYNRVSLKNNSTNWGSCSRLNNINLNIHLVRLSDTLADYVILHELCHLKHRNHGNDFHLLLDSLCGGNESLYSKQLRSLSPQTY